jgi:predicted nucleic acid-binding protein
MPVDAFVDTNVLVYAARAGADERVKGERALELIDSFRLGISAQVLQEFYLTTTRKVRRPLTAEKALEWMEALAAFPCVAVDKALVAHGVWISQRYQISYWDGAIVAAAQALEAPLLYSEDLSHGQRYEGIEVRNPFV